MKRFCQPFGPSLLLLAGLLAIALPGPSRAASRLLVVEAARDTTRGFRAQELPSLGRRALTWPGGVITLPDTAAWLEHGTGGLAFRLDENRFAGIGAGGRFRAEEGSYEIDTPLYLSDGLVAACLASGRLEVQADRIIYRAQDRGRDRRGDLLLLGGLVLATAVLLRAARRRTRRA